MKKLISVEFFKRLFITLNDFGLKRLLRRIRYEIRLFIDKYIPDKISLIMIGYNDPKCSSWKKLLTKLEIKKHNLTFKTTITKNEKLLFKFLNYGLNLKLPLKSWNNNEWQRLWQFNLHYFDWARESVDLYLEKKLIDEKLLYIPLLIEQWIEHNHLGNGDGWHSYTISLRLRNWIWILRTFPEIVNRKIISSIWQQTCWLSNHLENANGGNHYLENITSLIISSLQFESKESEIIYKKYLLILKNELNNQILDDGGHEERTASYHILILDRLIEVGCCIKSIRKEVPSWLTLKIIRMLDWLSIVILEKNNFPNFNDSPKDGCPNLQKVLDFGRSFIYKNFNSKKLSGIRKNLLREGQNNKIFFKKKSICSIENLKETGWSFIRPGEGWELIFKSGKSCPKHLPGHAHSDLLTFDVYKNGNPIIVEAGTSTYQNNSIRGYERSGKAHNVIQLSSRKYEKDILNYEIIEPIDIWNSFRAGKKANTFGRFSRFEKSGIFTIQASHDGYKNIKTEYTRKLSIKLESKNTLLIDVKDIIITRNKLYWRKWIHLSPYIGDYFFKKFIKDLKNNNKNKFKIIETSYSEGFGKRKKRKSICFYGITSKGYNTIITKLNLNEIFST